MLYVFIEPFSFFSVTDQGIDLDYCDTEWFALEINRDPSVVFGIAFTLDGMMLKLKLQYFGHLMQRGDSLEKTLMLGGIRGRRRRG